MAKVLVTGGSGFIGSHTIVDLLNHGFEVISIDDFSRSDPKILEGVEEITGKKVTNFNVDLKDKSAVLGLKEHCKDVDGIIHFAAYKAVGESVEHPLRYFENNLQSLINTLYLAETCSINSYVFSSSCTVYGNVNKLPVDETTLMGEVESPYGRTKQMGEQIIQDFISKGGPVKSILLRYFNPVGAHSSAKIGELPIGIPNNLIPYITQTAIGLREQLTVFGSDYETRDGTNVRDYIHVMDIANAHTKALQYMLAGKMKEPIDVFNLGTGNGVTTLEVVNAFEEANNLKLNYRLGERRSGDVVKIYADNQKAKQELGWEIERDLHEMMRSAWEWQKRLGKENRM